MLLLKGKTLIQEEFLRMKQRENEMSATIKNLKEKYNWFSEF